MTTPHSALGGLLRRLVEALDGQVEQAYRQAGLDFRPRYTPIVRLLFSEGPLRIRDLAERTGLTHSALSQTVTQLQSSGWVALEPGKDRRERFVHLTDKARQAEPALTRQWLATAQAATSLDQELPHDLEPLLEQALQALARRPFGDRIADALDVLPEGTAGGSGPHGLPD
jgi:DNA-binding MarR family transcriptional regulator